MDKDSLPTIEPVGSHLCTLELYRMPGGAIHARLIEMPVHVVEVLDTIPARFNLVADWAEQAPQSLRQQGAAFVEALEQQP